MAASRMFDPVSDRLDQTADSARETARHAQGAYDEARRVVPGLTRSAQKAFSDGVEHIRSQGLDVADAAGEQFDHARDYVIEHVQDRPLTATLAALGAGFVLGLLFAGNRR